MPKVKESSSLSPVYFVYGAERLLVEQEVEGLFNRCLSPEEQGLNAHVFEGTEHGAHEIIQTARTVPMLSRRRWVLVNDADRMEAKEVERLMEYVRKPSPTTCLVLRGQSLGSWKRFQPELEVAGEVVERNRLKSKDLLIWVRKNIEAKGKRLSDEASNYLLETLGNDLQTLETILERIVLGVGEKKTIGLSDVTEVVSEVNLSTVFELTEAVAEQNLDKGLALLGKALRSKSVPFRRDEESARIEDPVPLLLNLIWRQYRQILAVKELSQDGLPSAEMAKRLHIPPWNLRKLEGQARRYPLSFLREAILRCHQTDVAIKRGEGAKELLVEKLVMDLCRRQKEEPAGRRGSLQNKGG